MTGIAIQRADLNRRGALIRLASELIPRSTPEFLARRWWWTHDPPPVWIARDEATGRDLGMAAGLPFVLDTAKGALKAAWLVDYFLHPDSRGKGIGPQLTKQIMREFDVVASLQQSDAAYRSFRKLGWSERRMHSRQLGFAPASALASALRQRNKAGAPPVQIDTFEILSPQDFTSDFNELNTRLANSVPLRVSKTQAELARRYGAFADRRYHLLVAHAQSGLAGFAIVRVAPKGALRTLGPLKPGLILELHADPSHPALCDRLAAEAIRMLCKLGAQAIVALPGDSRQAHAFSRLGLLSARTPLVGRALSQLDIGLTAWARPGCEQVLAAAWKLQLGDCDLELALP